MEAGSRESQALDPTLKRRVRRTALRAAELFALAGVAWIASTDVLLLLNPDNTWSDLWPRTLNRAAFVVVSATIVYLLVERYGRQWARAESAARRSEDHLLRSEARFRLLVERVPGVVWLNEVSPDDPSKTHCVYVSPQLEELLGYAPEEWMVDDDLWLRVIHPADQARVAEINTTADETGMLSMEYRAIHRDGSTVWIHDEAVLVPADGDRPAYWQGVMVDITAQRMQDEALHELSESLRGVFEASPLAISVLEPDGRVRHWNPAAERMFGWTAAEVVGKSLPTVPADMLETYRETQTRTLGGESTTAYETVRLRKDGSRIDVSVSTAPLVGPDGLISGWLGVIDDITERKKADDRLQATLEAAPDAMIGVDRDGVIVMVNQQTEAVFGYHRDELIGSELEILLPDRVKAIHPAHRHRYFEEPRARPMGIGLDLAGRRSDGTEFPAEISLSWIETADGIVALGAIRDITDRKRFEEERRVALDRQLRLSKRLELLHQIDRDILSSASVEEMAERSLDRLRRLVPYDRGSIYLLDSETGRFSYAAVRADPDLVMDPDLGSTIPDAIARDLLARDVHVIDDLQAALPPTPFADGALRIGLRSVVLIGLRRDEGQMGSLILSSRRVAAFDQEAVAIATEVGSELAIAIAQARLRDAVDERARELERLAEDRRQMLHRIVRTQEEERERVALELHDGLGQILTSISLFASDLEQEVGPQARPRINRVNELIRRAIADSRQLVWSLRPPELERLGLVPALRRLADDVSLPELTVDLHEDLGDARLPPESEAVVYRVVQEAVHNAQKHAAASAISILLQRTNGQLTTLVEDNGRGFDPAALPPGRGLGLIGMRERAELVQGVLVVESASQAGTRVRLMVPIGASEGSVE